jgi:type III restriction enzyme
MTIRIDSKVVEDIAARGMSDETTVAVRPETIGKTEWPGRKVPAEYAAIVGTAQPQCLGGRGPRCLAVTNPDVPPGRDVRCIILVSMLSEGWDATTVTQVAELRSFGSQLLCKPMVDPRAPADVLLFETAQIFGAPSELIPFKMEGGMPQVR